MGDPPLRLPRRSTRGACKGACKSACKSACTGVRSLFRVALLLVALNASAFAAAAAAAPAAVGSDAPCLMCHAPGERDPLRDVYHGPHGVAGDARTPIAQGGCESCHGPSAGHLALGPDGSRQPPPVTFAADEPVALGNAACLSCHGDTATMHWSASLHAQSELSCNTCHDGHVRRDPMTIARTQVQVCTGCHLDVRSQIHRRSAHPLRDGQQSCTSCHAPHGAMGDAMLVRSAVNDTCYECHAEKRGPFLWEHAPVGEDCSHCHAPHGSQHASLLIARTPWLCQQCHLAQFHPSTALSGTGIPPVGASQLMLIRDCMNCHVQVHGSNHPSGPGQIR
jgi:DmsE family decaheme c-type cytochrome